MKYIQFNDWGQSIRYHRPQFIKSKLSYLDDPNYLSLTASERGILHDMMLLSGVYLNLVPYTKHTLSRHLAYTRHALIHRTINKFIELGWISVVQAAEKASTELEKSRVEKSIRSKGVKITSNMTREQRREASILNAKMMLKTTANELGF